MEAGQYVDQVKSLQGDIDNDGVELDASNNDEDRQSDSTDQKCDHDNISITSTNSDFLN